MKTELWRGWWIGEGAPDWLGRLEVGREGLSATAAFASGTGWDPEPHAQLEAAPAVSIFPTLELRHGQPC